MTVRVFSPLFVEMKSLYLFWEFLLFTKFMKNKILSTKSMCFVMLFTKQCLNFNFTVFYVGLMTLWKYKTHVKMQVIFSESFRLFLNWLEIGTQINLCVSFRVFLCVNWSACAQTSFNLCAKPIQTIRLSFKK